MDKTIFDKHSNIKIRSKYEAYENFYRGVHTFNDTIEYEITTTTGSNKMMHIDM